MSALDVVHEEWEEKEKGLYEFKGWKPYSSLRIFVFVPVEHSSNGLIIVGANNLETARSKIKEYMGLVKYIGEASTLEELLDILSPHKNKRINRKDIWDFLVF